MSGEYDRLRDLLLTPESSRLDVLEEKLAETRAEFATVPDRLAEDIERNVHGGERTRLGDALTEATTGSLELAVRRKPETVVNVVYPVIGPAIRRSIAEALREMSDGFDRSMRETFSPRALRWRFEAWRTGIPYAWVVLRQTTRYQVEHLFMIEPDSGLLLGHVTAKGLPELDADAVAGMFTAINQFVRDSVSVDGGEGGIGSALVGGYHLAVSEGPHARLVAFVRGVPDQHFGVRLDEINEALHAHHGSELLPDGRPDDHESSFLEQSQLDALNPRDQAVAGQQQSQSRILRIVLGVLVLALLATARYWWPWMRGMGRGPAPFRDSPQVEALVLPEVLPDDIAAAARALAADVAAGRLRAEDIDEAAVGARMALADLPPPDLFIRTGGDTRISNFLLWQLAYTELWFTDVLWPEFDAAILQQALDAYAARERRFGLTSAQIAALATETSNP